MSSTRAAIYIRWSTEDQGEGTTLQVQREACLRYCEQQGWAVADIYVDDGYSGGNLFRPALDRLRAEVQAGRVDAVVVYRLDRLSRNVADAATLVDREWKGRVAVRSATEEVQPEADEGWLNFTFRAAFAEYERRIIRQRTMAGKLRRAQEGRWIATPPYGYRRGAVKGTLSIHEEEAAVVRRLFERCVHENLGTPSLARWANEMSFPPPRGERWAGSNLLKLLQNPVYAGRIVYGSHRTLKSSRAEAGPWRAAREPLVDIEAAESVIPRIIPRELWQRAQEVLASRRTLVRRATPRGSASPYLLTGLVYCPCGSRLKAKPHGRGLAYLYYRCRSTTDIGRCPFGAGHIPMEVLEQAVVSTFLERLAAGDALERISRHWQAQGVLNAGELQERLRVYRERLKRLAERMEYIDRQYMDQELSALEMRRMRRMVEREEQEARAAVREAEEELAAALNHLQDWQRMLATLEQVRHWGKITETDQKRFVLSQFIRRVVALRRRGSAEVEVEIEWSVAAERERSTVPAPRRK